MGSPEDPIVNLVNDLAKQIDVSGLSFSSVAWEQGIERRNRGWMAIRQPTVFIPIPSDTAIFAGQMIYLVQNMQGKLTLDEWRPLLASALINYRKLRTRKIVWILSLVVPVLALYVAGWFLLPPLFPTTTSCSYGKCAVNNWAWDGLIIGGPILAIALIIASALTMRRFKWIADKETARLFGADQLISSLRRVSEVSPSDDWTVQKNQEALTSRDSHVVTRKRTI